MSVELHIPDLPEVPIALGPAPDRPPRPRLPWHLRLREAVSAYLPLLLMGLLALATWWLVKHSPRAEPPRAERAAPGEPDYEMRGFALERFDPAGRLVMRIEGGRLRHFPDADRYEIDDAQIRAFAPDGRETVATARRAVGLGDGSRLLLEGGAEVRALDAAGQPMVMRSEVLLAELDAQRISSPQPVSVRHGSSELRAAGLLYEQAAQRLTLTGPLRAVLAPRATPAAGRPSPAPSGAPR